MIRSSCEIYAERTAFLIKSDGVYKPIKYKEYMEDVNALGTKFIDMGLKGEKIAVVGEASYSWALTYMAVLCGVGVIVPLDKELPKEELLNLINIADVKMIVYSPKVKAITNEVKVEYKIQMGPELDALVEEGRVLLENGDKSYIDTEINSEEMSVLLFTSGTTGVAKGVMHSHKTLCVNLMSMVTLLYIDPSDVFLSVLPIHHTYECTCGFLCALYRGSSIAYCEGLRYIAKNLQESKATIILGVPLLFENMYKNIWKQIDKNGMHGKVTTAIKISNAAKKVGINITKKLFKQIHESLGGHINLLISGAAAIDPKVAKGFRDFGIQLVQGYGLTECAPIAALNREVLFKDDAAGLPLSGVEVKIDGANSEGIGEIIIKGGNVMLGYYKDPELTAAAIVDGWYHSGDIGYIDEDGFVHITGRMKNVIIAKNGKNVFPEELETYLGRSNFIAESLVSGKEKNDDVIISAQILPNYEEVEALLGKDYTQTQLIELIKKEVMTVNEIVQGYKRITSFSIRIHPFDKTTTQKIKRFKETNISEEGNIQAK
ncbi:MAG: AMP-binding protein [Bacillota bacterium]|nr:AMP-binding protein [Bacillota bacterium]